MNSRLVNVRLDARRLERARRLRAQGIALSKLVRDAIDREYEQSFKTSKSRDVEAIMKEIYQQYPDPHGLPPRDYSVHNRREAADAILRKLRSRRR